MLCLGIIVVQSTVTKWFISPSAEDCKSHLSMTHYFYTDVYFFMDKPDSKVFKWVTSGELSAKYFLKGRA